MRIVREQCLAGFASLRSNDPRVAAVKLCEAWKQRIAVQRGKDAAIDAYVNRPCSRFCNGGGRFFNAAAKFVDLLRRCVVEHFAVENVASKCFRKAVAQISAESQHVGYFKFARFVSQDCELHRQPLSFDEVVQPVTVGFGRAQNGGAHRIGSEKLFGVVTKPESSRQFIDLNSGRPENLTELAIGETAVHIHLEQPILSSGKAECAKGIEFVIRENVRDAPLIAHNADLTLE